MKILQKIGAHLVHHLSRPRKGNTKIATSTPEKLSGCLRPGDVLLVEGNSTFSTAIKYLTLSNTSSTIALQKSVTVSGQRGSNPGNLFFPYRPGLPINKISDFTGNYCPAVRRSFLFGLL